jgi:hypothetical protein
VQLGVNAIPPLWNFVGVQLTTGVEGKDSRFLTPYVAERNTGLSKFNTCGVTATKANLIGLIAKFIFDFSDILRLII